MMTSRAKNDEIDLLRAKTDYLNPSISADWAKKKLMWVPSEKDGFALGAVIGNPHPDGTIDIELMETGERQRVSSDDCQKPNPPKYEKCEDMSMLTCLNEASVLHNLKQRYFSNLYYVRFISIFFYYLILSPYMREKLNLQSVFQTYSGLFCVVINPYKRIPIYTDSIAEQFKGKKRKEMPPHVFAVTEEAYRSMLQERDDQSILCTGESGAGKTENTKKVIQYLAYVANRNMLKNRKTSTDLDISTNRVMGQLEEQLLQANPILEAFGNSKTVKNDNSSRFGKFIRVHFDGTGCISGANIEFYLLEKSRVLRQAPNERSFHIFYQLLKGLPKSQRDQFLLEDSLSKYKYLTHGDSKLAGVDDGAEMKETLNAMSIMGLNDEEITGILRVVSAVMLFGNLEFSQENKNNDQATLLNDAVAQKIAALLGVNVTELMRAFLKPKIKVQRDMVHRSQSVDQVNFAVGAIAKASYERLFRWLVHRLNKSLGWTRQQLSRSSVYSIWGFEILKPTHSNNGASIPRTRTFNSYSTIQWSFVTSREYLDEGLEWKFVDFGLNLQPTIDLIDKPMGLMSTLDDVCLFPQGNDQSFVQRLNDTHSQHPKYVVPEIRSRSDFAVVHYAGRVDYQASGWRVKNMDPLNENVIDVLKAAKESIILDMWKDIADVCSLSAADSGSDTGVFGSRMPKKGMFRTVSQLYKEQLTRLMSTLNNTNPHFVRCIIPNHEKKHGVLNAHLVLDQLRCNGVLEGIRICRQGFPTRLPFHEFRQRYEKLLANDVIPAGFMDGKEAVRRIIQFLEVDDNLFRIGQSKIFFRAGVVAEFEEMRDQKLSALIESFQAQCRGWLGRRIMVRRREQEVAIKILQRNGLAWMRLREWQWWRLLTKVKPLLEVTNKDELIAEKEQELRVTSERLRRSEVFIADCKQQMEKIDEERILLKTRLDAESSERAEMFEERSRIAARKIELEGLLDDVSKRLEAEEQKAKKAEVETRRLTEMVKHLEENLEDEERSRQKLLLEKNSIESRLKELEAQGVELEDSGNKLTKEKKLLEERCEDLSSRLIDETELFISIFREKHLRQQAENARRAADVLLREEQEACLEKTRKAEELTAQLMRKETELSQISMKNDEELAIRQQLEREIREIRAQCDDAVEELNKEKAARQKAEKARRDMAEELESYKAELEESNDKTNLQSQLKAKRDEEYAHLQRQLEDTLKTSDEAVEEIKAQSQKKIEELNETIDQLKRQKISVFAFCLITYLLTADKAKSSAESENENIRAELSNVASARQDAEKKRKTAEATLMEKDHKMREMQSNLEDLMAKLSKMNNELENIQKAKSAEETLNSNLLKKNASLDMQLSELTEASEEDRRTKVNLNNKIRQLEEDLAIAIEAKEDALAAQEKIDKEARDLKLQLAEAKKKLDEENREVMEEMRKKKEKELLAEKERADSAEQARDKAERAKKKALQEAEDVQKEYSDMMAATREMERKQRKHEQQLTDEKNNTLLAVQERDMAQQMIRDAETKALVLSNELSEKKDLIELLEKDKRMLKLEIDNLVRSQYFIKLFQASNKDDAGKNVYELEKTKRRLDEELNRAEQQIIELEDALQIAEDARSRVEVNMQALKAEFERQLAAREEDEEDRKKGLAAKIRNLTEELESEQRSRQNAVANKKKFELQVSELTEKNEAAFRQIEDLTRQLRKAQLSCKDFQLDASEARAALDDAVSAQRDAEKRARASEDEIKRLMADVQAVTSSKRKAEAERDELIEEVATLRASSFSNEEKRRLEAKVVDLEDQLDEEVSANELAQEKVRKAQQQLEQMTADLAMERSVCERNESDRIGLERANRDLKQQLLDAENTAVARLRTQINVAEAKVANLEQQLAVEEQDKMRQGRTLRRMETKMAEMQQMLEEERRQSETNRQAAERQNTRIRQLRTQLEDAEAERDRLVKKVNEERRRADDVTDLNETLTKDVTLMRQRETAARRTPGLMSHRESRRFGSNSSLARGENFEFCMSSSLKLNSDEFRGSALTNEMSPSDRPASRLTSGTGSQVGNLDEDRDSVRN
ncbi:Protein CBR-NMY-2 [Caenorhabditis briggsae]|uniref:Protein CBR-NMY-2 n=1 Tax=Caenorhabditis briggsae TaxID=6238 RepID=A8X651_CAEBR|nr:Protein CBR-NMY-2 [Caenorhabditis briggsae]CAP28112.2 Protein CBR-NMY-2 [Caenorhabditis briggsae]